MTNAEHLEILKSGIKEWNEWREEIREKYVDLNGANLSGANLSEADLREVNLTRAKLNRTVFGLTDLSSCNNLESVEVSGAHASLTSLRFDHLKTSQKSF